MCVCMRVYACVCVLPFYRDRFNYGDRLFLSTHTHTHTHTHTPGCTQHVTPVDPACAFACDEGIEACVAA